MSKNNIEVRVCDNKVTIFRTRKLSRAERKKEKDAKVYVEVVDVVFDSDDEATIKQNVTYCA